MNTTPGRKLTKAYDALFAQLSDDSRYATRSVAGFYVDDAGRPDPDKVTVVIRVDVDSGLHLVPDLARHMRARGLAGSFYFLTDPQRHYRLWDSGIPARTAALGFEVGLHTDHQFAELCGGPPALEALREDARRLEAEAGTRVRGAVFHGHKAMDALGRSNRETLLNVDPADAGLDYHDGLSGGYADPAAPGWAPPCDRAIGDFYGFPASWGFNYAPRLPRKELARAKPGEVVHLGLHAMNAFRYWLDWDPEYGEPRPQRESRLSFARKAASIRLRHGLLRGHSLSWAVLYALFAATSVVLAKGLGLFWPRGKGRKLFDTYDSERERIFGLGMDHWRAQLEDYGMAAPGGRVLDVGSGNGQWLVAAARDAAECVGIEPGREIREYCLEKLKEFPEQAAKITVLDGRAEFLPFPDAHFDRVICSGVFMFTDQPRALAEMARVLRPGGRLFLMVNGLGYFIMWCLDGLRLKDTRRMRYGLGGLAATLLKWRRGANLDRPKAVGVRELERMCAQNGLALTDVRLYMHQDIYPREHLGWPTNYVFLAEREAAPGAEETK